MPADRQCPGCGLDFALHRRTELAAAARTSNESFTEKFKGTEWETPIEVAPTVSRAQLLRPLVILWFALLAVTVGLFVAHQAGIFKGPIGLTEMAVAGLAIPFIAGTLSKVIPGRKARGPFKGWLVGYAGWYLGSAAAFFVTGLVLPSFPLTWDFYVDQLVLAILGTIVVRLILLFFD